MWYIFEKRIVQGYQKWYSHVSDAQIQKIQIHKYSKWRNARKTQHVAYFWKEDCSRVSKIIFPFVKHAKTQIQIHKYSKSQSARKTLHVVYFWKGDCSRMSSESHTVVQGLVYHHVYPSNCYHYNYINDGNGNFIGWPASPLAQLSSYLPITLLPLLSHQW